VSATRAERIHAIGRSAERYGVRLSARDLGYALWACKTGRALCLHSGPGGGVFHVRFSRGTPSAPRYVFVNLLVRGSKVVTALPPEDGRVRRAWR